jgi:hypothetical protein
MRYEFTKWPTDKSTRSGTDLASLERELAALGEREQFQLWMYRDDGESACVLANETFAWLSILPRDADDILSMDRDFTGPEETVVRIYLENGQLDEMAREHCVPRQLGIDAGLHYFRTGTRAPFLAWFAYDAQPKA